ncbi:putative wall-associated receptor kinase-like 16 [Prunus avium]|uniref:Wall-associated receptor kinase-like 16 n=1 Tax=Prunus avium TaxID=42229 RepID=A0A6P5U498_PRUAV|nr:putative wall-associated receptor kinase-like 16 [Prunus avium]
MEGVCFQSLHGNPIMQLISLLVIVLELVFVLAVSTSSTTAVGDDHQALLPQALPGCSDHCGNHGSFWEFLLSSMFLRHERDKLQSHAKEYDSHVSHYCYYYRSASSLCWGMKQRKYIKFKEKYSEENGGFLLQHKLASHHWVETTRIFTAEELEKATNNYHDSRVLGKGSYGIVHKGIIEILDLPVGSHSNNTDTVPTLLPAQSVRIAAPTQTEQFVNELVVLSQINHRNVVRLLGCCLESEVPLLVYEFINNGTLFEHIHGERSRGSSLVWELRLKIAAETAGALAYLHSSNFTQIIHRDVKAVNILLDDNYTTKVSDFGASVLIPLHQTQVVTLVQGTLGYLDPEYLHSNQLTEKSNVYSFGVVLVEPLTSKVAISYDRPEAERSLARLFVSAMEEDRLERILDCRIVNEQNIGTVRNVARLAKRCLRLKGEERPTMKDVAMELEGMRIATNGEVMLICVQKIRLRSCRGHLQTLLLLTLEMIVVLVAQLLVQLAVSLINGLACKGSKVS